MAEVTWIKLSVDMFNNKKIKQIRKLPGGNDIVLLWVMMLNLAGKSNSQGYILLTENIPYNPETLAIECDFELTTVKMGLDIFQKFNMIEFINDSVVISGWLEHQNFDKLEEIREYNRLKKQESRQRQKLLGQENVNDSQGESQGSQETDIDKEEDKDKDIDIDKEENKKVDKIPWKEILIAWNDLPNPINPIRAITDRRKDKINARVNSLKLTISDVVQAINNVKTSSFCQGKNNKNWVIDFDWLFKDDNSFSKVLEGKYNNSTTEGANGAKHQYNKNVQNGLEIYNKALQEEQNGQGGKSIWDV